MCDYSLHDVASRPARVGDELISTRFPASITRGFAASNEPGVAVCLLPGTEVAFESDVESEPRVPLFRRQSIKQRVARFRQIDLDEPHTHHDALEFPNCEIVLVTKLTQGQRATVLQLPARPAERAHQETQEFASDTA